MLACGARVFQMDSEKNIEKDSEKDNSSSEHSLAIVDFLVSISGPSWKISQVWRGQNFCERGMTRNQFC